MIYKNILIYLFAELLFNILIGIMYLPLVQNNSLLNTFPDNLKLARINHCLFSIIWLIFLYYNFDFFIFSLNLSNNKLSSELNITSGIKPVIVCIVFFVHINFSY